MVWTLNTPVLETAEQKYERQLKENFERTSLFEQVREIVETVKKDWYFMGLPWKEETPENPKTCPDCLLICPVTVLVQRQMSLNPGMPSIRLTDEKKQLVVAVDFVKEGPRHNFPLAYKHRVEQYSIAHFGVNDALALMHELDKIRK